MGRQEQEKFLINAMLDILRQSIKRNETPTVIKICSFLELDANNEIKVDPNMTDYASTSSSFLSEEASTDPSITDATSERELSYVSSQVSSQLDVDDYIFALSQAYDDPPSVPPLEIMAVDPLQDKLQSGPMPSVSDAIEPPVDVMFPPPEQKAILPETSAESYSTTEAGESNIYMDVREIPTLDDIAEAESGPSVNEQSPGFEIQASLNNLLAEADKEFELRMNKSPRVVNISEEISNETEYKFGPILQTADSTSRPTNESGMVVSTASVFTTREPECSFSDRKTDYHRFKSISDFHARIKVIQFRTEQEVEDFLKKSIEQFFGECGLLLFLYSVLMTKGVSELKAEIGDLSEPLIHEEYGYGSQSLVNLMLTGRAVQYVWDYDQDVGGLSKYTFFFTIIYKTTHTIYKITLEIY